MAAWRDSARTVRIYGLDARLIALAALFIAWPSWATTILLAAGIVALRIADARGYRLPTAARALRARLAGRREALAPPRRRRFTDFG
ncbi:MAG: IcmT/TraK family protein [Rhodospirillaceae bacterium]|nr:IcmT/TraK family protein [Rhodospirillaceae bacterium]